MAALGRIVMGEGTRGKFYGIFGSMRGPKPKSNALRLVQGNTDHREHLPGIVVDGELGGPPNWFQPEQRLEWDRIMRTAPPGALTELDRQLMINYCIAATMFNDCAQKLATSGGPVVLSPVKNYPQQSPYVSIMNQQQSTMKGLLAELGFSPTSRTRVKAPNGKRKGSSTFADLKKFKIQK